MCAWRLALGCVRKYFRKNILSCTVYKTGKEINFNKFIWVRIEENDFF